MIYLRIGLGIVASVLCVASILAAPGHDHDHDHDHAKNREPEHVDEVVLSPEAIQQHGIVISAVQKQSLVDAVLAPARVTFNSDAMAHVGSAVSGRVSDLRVKLGSQVSKGDLLAIVESPELGEAQSDLLLKRAEVDTAQSGEQLARDALDRARRLQEAGQAIAASEVQKRELELRVAQNALRAAQAAATAAENKLHLFGMSHEDLSALLKTGEIIPRFRVLAPISGQVIEREVTLGELVNPDRDALMIIADLSAVWVIADVPEARIRRVREGDAASVVSAAHADGTIQGKVSYIAPALDPTTRTGKVRIEVRGEPGSLRPGTFAQVTIWPPADANTMVLAIPETAVQRVEGTVGVFVPVENEPNTFAVRAVKIGQVIGGMVEVLDGLKEGQSIVTQGGFILKAELGKAGAAHEH